MLKFWGNGSIESMRLVQNIRVRSTEKELTFDVDGIVHNRLQR